jgi:hypothetical protein
MSTEADVTEAILERIRATDDVKEKVEAAGLTRKPFKGGEMEQSCSTCIYFLPRHAHCDQPDLNFPVNPDWWCRLWRL